MKLLFACHRNPYKDQEGGEISVSMIIEYLRGKGHQVDVVSRKKGLMSHSQFDSEIASIVSDYDHVYTWAQAAPATAKGCINKGIPYTLMIRWWRLVSPLPPGRLLDKPLPTEHIEQHRYIFENAAKVITNTKFACKVIEKYYGIKAECSYVPISTKDEENVRDPDGPAVIVSPDKNLGEWDVINEFNGNGSHIRVVNAKEKPYLGTKIEYVEKQDQIKEALRGCSCLLSPVFYNDVCGTTRVVIEAMRHGLPVFTCNESGMGEWIPETELYEYERDSPDMWVWVKKTGLYDPKPIWEKYKEQQPDSLKLFEP